MTRQNWDIEKTTIEEITKHLTDFHSVNFNDRRALSTNDFIEEHFPSLIRDMEDSGYGFLSARGRARLIDVRKLLSAILKYCEDNGIAIAKVYDFNEKGEGEWRICKPTHLQLEYLKFKRWFASAEGFFNKAVMQEKMISLPDLEVLMQELKDKIIQRQRQRANLQIKKQNKGSTGQNNKDDENEDKE